MSLHSSWTAAAVLLTGTLFVTGCGDPSQSSAAAPTAPSSLAPSEAQAVFAPLGNSDAAHRCQQGGHRKLFRADGSAFKNVGDCVSYAAQGGMLATRHTATLTNVLFSACNALSLGYTLDGVDTVLASKGFVCATNVAVANQTIKFLSTQTLRLFLRDNTCSFKFPEDGSHATKTGMNPFTLTIADGGSGCVFPPAVARVAANLSLTETITDGW